MKNSINDSQKINAHPKILYIATLGRTGGVYQYIGQLAEKMRNDFDITVAAGEGGGDLTVWAAEQGIKAFPLEHLGRELSFGAFPTVNDVRTFFDLFRHIRAERYDIVHLNSSKMGLIGAIAARLSGCRKVVFTAHGWVFNEPKTIRGKRSFWILVSKFAAYFQDYIICVSEYDFDQALRYRIAPPRKLITIHNGLDVNKIAYLARTKPRKELEERINATKETIIAGTIANSYSTKDLGTMIKAVSLIKNYNVKLAIIGEEGPVPHKELVASIKYQGLEDRVFLLGRIENAAQYLKAFDMYLISSLKEGLPFSALEAMAAGLPIVSTTVGGLNELLFADEKKPAALNFSPGGANALAHQIETVLTNKDLAATLSQNAKERVSALFSLEKMLVKTRCVYELQ